MQISFSLLQDERIKCYVVYVIGCLSAFKYICRLWEITCQIKIVVTVLIEIKC